MTIYTTLTRLFMSEAIEHDRQTIEAMLCKRIGSHSYVPMSDRVAWDQCERCGIMRSPVIGREDNDDVE